MQAGRRHLDVVVIGGSLGGLFAGVALKRLGHNVRILERNPTPLLHNQGAGIVVGGDTQSFFERYDLTRTPIAVTSPKRQYLDRYGNQIHEEDLEQKMTSWDLLYNLLRANFDGDRGSYVRPPPENDGDGRATYDYGCTFIAVSETGDKRLRVTFQEKDGREEDAVSDLVIAADGPSSTVRGVLEPAVERKYAGYVAWRGTVPENELSAVAMEQIVERFSFYHSAGLQILAYVIPGDKGSLAPGDRLANWVWYRNAEEGSEEHRKFMTDSEGKKHKVTLPVGRIDRAARKELREAAEKLLPPSFTELVAKTRQPFVQAITDVIASRNSYFDGRLLLLGDAIAGFRPHTAASTSQAAFDSLSLIEMMEGRISREQWERITMQYARDVQRRGVIMGDRSQFGRHHLSS